jgi:transcriptional regulator with XRE-family HTH domain
MTAAAPLGQSDFKTLIRRWRQHRKRSQLELALAADVSQRHVSWLETGRSQPSREMVIRLAEALEIPLRERNALLQSAGFAALYTEKRLDEPGMEPVLEAVSHVLRHHDPYPAFAVDRFWTVKMQNASAGRLFALLGDASVAVDAEDDGGEPNLALLSLHPQGLRPFIANWSEIAPSFIRRLRSEAIASGDAEMHARFERYVALAEPVSEAEWGTASLSPVLPLVLDLGGTRLRTFSIITTIGTPQDVTADELRIEAFFPADAATEQVFRSLSD